MADDVKWASVHLQRRGKFIIIFDLIVTHNIPEYLSKAPEDLQPLFKKKKKKRVPWLNRFTWQNHDNASVTFISNA